MGEIIHDCVLVTVHASEPQPDITAFRASAPPWLRPLIVGPRYAGSWDEDGGTEESHSYGGGGINGEIHYAFLPDGSKEGWAPSKDGAAWRRNFAQLFGPQAHVVCVRYGPSAGRPTALHPLRAECRRNADG